MATRCDKVQIAVQAGALQPSGRLSCPGIAGTSRKLPACSSLASSTSTCRRRWLSAPQIASRNDFRASGVRSSAAWKSSSTFRQSSCSMASPVSPTRHYELNERQRTILQPQGPPLKNTLQLRMGLPYPHYQPASSIVGIIGQTHNCPNSSFYGPSRANDREGAGAQGIYFQHCCHISRDHSWITGTPEVIGSSVGLVPRNDRSLSGLPRSRNAGMHRSVVGAVSIGSFEGSRWRLRRMR
jgi:hypothetical protein